LEIIGNYWYTIVSVGRLSFCFFYYAMVKWVFFCIVLLCFASWFCGSSFIGACPVKAFYLLKKWAILTFFSVCLSNCQRCRFLCIFLIREFFELWTEQSLKSVRLERTEPQIFKWNLTEAVCFDDLLGWRRNVIWLVAVVFNY